TGAREWRPAEHRAGQADHHAGLHRHGRLDAPAWIARGCLPPGPRAQRAILGAAAGAHGGTGYATGGDGCVFLFGSPRSAVATAVEAQRALAVERWPDGVSVRVRMAIHAGEVTSTSSCSPLERSPVPIPGAPGPALQMAFT